VGESSPIRYVFYVIKENRTRVISPYPRSGRPNHTIYSTSGMLRTTKLLRGLPPMSQVPPPGNCSSASTEPRPWFLTRPARPG